MTLSDIEEKARQQCDELGMDFEGFQSNHEGALLDRIHAARLDGTSAIIINAGAYTHTSVALRDALSGIKVPFIEVHVSPRRRQSTGLWWWSEQDANLEFDRWGSYRSPTFTHENRSATIRTCRISPTA